MQQVQYPTLAAAVGAFVAGEMQACIADPTLLMLDTEYSTETATEFDMVYLEYHLQGLLSDLVDICITPPEGVLHADFAPYAHQGGVLLMYATDEEHRAEKREWQKCAQGYAHLKAL